MGCFFIGHRRYYADVRACGVLGGYFTALLGGGNHCHGIGAVCACLYTFIVLRLRSKAISIYSYISLRKKHRSIGAQKKEERVSER